MKILRLLLFAALLAAAVAPAGPLRAQAPAERPRPAVLGLPVPDFSLPALQGGDYSIAKLRGKNILIIFPRGKVDDHWCQICHYQYAELAELEKTLHLRDRHNLEILYVLPYDKAAVQHWADIFPDQMAVIEGWKNPPASASEGQKNFARMVKMMLPKSFDIKKGEVPLPFPILIDADRRVSKGLGLFTMEWDQSRVDQNIPMMILVDEAGVVQFKYLSQITWDRASGEYLVKILGKLIPGK